MLKKIGIVFFLFIIGIFAYSIGVVFQAASYADEVILKDYGKGEWRIYGGEKRLITLSVEDLNQKQIDWLLKIQDPGFYGHKGIDLLTPGAGLTTVTQSIVKKLYFKEFKPGYRKYKQSLIARFVVNKKLKKNEQLEIFLNSVYMGSLNGVEIYGLSKASQVYYRKSFKQLSDDEYLSLIAMLIGPNQFSILKEPKKNKERVSRIKAVLTGEYKPRELTDVYYNRT
jgi:membrane carboxypeptidase/penicillin-binding protein